MRLEGRLNKLHAQLEAELGQPAFTPAEPANR
jgi:hypothetical protein